MVKKKVLLAGESWVSAATHYKGHDQFASVTFHLGAAPLVAALKDSPFELDYMPGHDVPEVQVAARQGKEVGPKEARHGLPVALHHAPTPGAWSDWH